MKGKELFFIALLIPGVVTADDSCRDILTNGFYNSYSKSSTQARDQAMFAELCSSNFEQAKNTIKKAEQSGSGGSLGVSYGLFSLDGGGSSSSNSSFTEEKFNQWKSQYCTKNSETESSRAAEFLMQKTVAESVVNAWSGCMREREGLSCWANPYSDEVLLNINWKRTSLTQPKVQNSFISKGVISDYEGTTPGKILPSGHSLNPGTLQVVLSRSKENKILATLNATHDGVSHSCNVFVPGESEFQLSKPANVQSAVRSEELGCKAKAWPEGENCGGRWSYIAPANYKVCTVEVEYNGGPTDGAKMELKDASDSDGKVEWKVLSNPVPFGGGRWVSGYVTVTYVPTERQATDDGLACSPKRLSEVRRVRR